MKIFVDAHFLDGRKHGAAIYLDRLYTQYRQLQPDDDLYFGIERDAVAEYPLFKLPRVHVLRYRLGGGLRFVYDIPLILRRIGADVVHTQYVAPLRWGHAARRHVSMHDVLYEDFPELFSFRYRISRQLIFGWSARQAELISTISEYSRARIAALYGRSASDIHLVVPGVVEDEDAELPSQGDALHDNSILYVSRFERRKNHLALLKALDALRPAHSNLRLVLVGFDVDGTLPQLQQFVAEHGLEAAVDIRNNVGDAELQTLYRRAAVVVYPSFGEGFGMPIIEAFLLNPYTLFSNATAMAEFSFAPNNMFDPADQSTLTAKIDAALRKRAAGLQPPDWNAQRRLVVERYNWRASARKLAALYHGHATAASQPTNAGAQAC